MSKQGQGTLTGSKRKRSDDRKHQRNSKKQKAIDLSIFSQLPPEVFLFSVVPCIPLDFIYVSKEYHTIALKNLHSDSRVKLDLSSFISVISSHNNKAFRMHIKYGNLSEYDIIRGLDTAVKEKNRLAVKRLLKMDFLKNCSPEGDRTYIEQAAWTASLIGDTKILKYLLRHIAKPDVPTTILQEAGYKGNIATIKTVIKYGLLLPNADYTQVLRRLAEKGEIKYLQRLLDDQKLDLSNASLILTFGHVMFDNEDITRLLVQYLKIDPADSWFLERAVKSSSPKSLMLFLSLGIFDPMANNANAVKEAILCRFSKLKMLKILLADPRVDLSQVPDALKWAELSNCFKNGTEIFELLIKQPTINPLCRDPESDPMTLDGEKFFSSPIVQEMPRDYMPPLPEDLRDPTIIDVMLKSFMKVDLHLLFLVLNHPRVNFKYYAGYTIMRSLQAKKSYVTEAVLKDSRVKVIDKQHYKIAMECAEKHSLNEITAKISALKKKKTLDFKLRPQDVGCNNNAADG